MGPMLIAKERENKRLKRYIAKELNIDVNRYLITGKVKTLKNKRKREETDKEEEDMHS